MATNIVVRFIGETSSLQRAFAQATAGSKAMSAQQASLSTALSRSGTAWMNFGRSVTMASVPIILAGGYAIKAAVDYEDTVSKMSRLTNASTEDTKKWSEQILDLSKDVAVGPQKLAEALYFVASSGAPVDKAMGIVEVAAKGAAAGLGEVQTTADMATSVMNVYGAENLSAAEAMDILTEAVRLGKGEADAYAKVVGRITPVANQLGIEFNEVGAAMSIATNRGLSVAESATGIRQTFMALVKPTKAASDLVEAQGTNFDNIRKIFKEKGLLAGYNELKRLSGGNAENMSKLLPNVRGLNAFLNIMSEDTMPETVSIFGQMKDSTGELDTAFEKTQKTAKFKLNKAMSTLQSVAIEVGSIALPMVSGAAEKLAEWFGKVGELSPELQKAIVIGMGVAAVIGPVTMIVGGFQKALGFLLGPVGLTMLAIIGIGIGLVWLYNNWEPFNTFINEKAIPTFEKLVDIIKTDFPKGVQAMKDAWNSRGEDTGAATGWRKEVLDSIGTINRAVDETKVSFPVGIKAIQDAWSGKGNTQGLTGWGENFVSGLGRVRANLEAFPGECRRATERVKQFFEDSGIAQAFAATWNWVVQIFVSTWQIILGAWKVISGIFGLDWTQMWEGIKQIFGGVWDWIVSLFSASWAWILAITRIALTGIWSVITFIWNAIYGFMRGIVLGIVKTVTGIWGKATDGLSSLWNSVKFIWDLIVGHVKGVASTIWETAQGMWKPVADTVGSAMRGVVDAWNKLDISIGPWTVPDWVPGLGGKTFHIPDLIPDVRLAKGGIINGPTVAMLGEGYRKEVVFPTNDPERGYSLLAAAGIHAPSSDGGGTVINYSPRFTLLNPHDAARINEREMNWIQKTNGR